MGRHPTIPRTLILASVYAGWAGSLPPEGVEPRKQLMLRLIDLPREQFAREFIPTLLTDAAPAELVDEGRAILSDFHPAGQRAIVRAGFAEHDVRAVLPGIDVPTPPALRRQAYALNGLAIYLRVSRN